MKHLVMSLIVLMGSHAYASWECMGKDGKITVTVRMETAGARGEVQSGLVTFSDADNSWGYPIAKTEITGFYERSFFDSTDTVLGLTAYNENENPVEVYYVGENYADQDLTAVLAKADRVKAYKSKMVLWKGQGNPSTEQYEINDVVCGAWTGI